MTMLHAGADTSRPGQPLPPGTTILCIYVGAKDLPGPPDATHIWTIDETNLYLDPASKLYGGPELRVLPIYVHDYPGDPVIDAKNAIDALIDMGWETNAGRIVFWDAETLVDDAYCTALNVEVRKLGFRLGKYGSQGTINHNTPVDGGTWVATDSRIIPLALPPDRVGDQWFFGGDWDLSGFDHFVYENCGVGPRQAEAARFRPASATGGSARPVGTAGPDSWPLSAVTDPFPPSSRPRPA